MLTFYQHPEEYE